MLPTRFRTGQRTPDLNVCVDESKTHGRSIKLFLLRRAMGLPNHLLGKCGGIGQKWNG